MRRVVFATGLLMIATRCLPAQHYRVLHSFSGYPNDAASVVSSLVFDQQGNLYGTSAGGGDGVGDICAGLGCGTVFELSPNGDGTFKESLLYSFCTVYNGTLCLDGVASWAGLAIDSAGNLYGTTTGGGSQNGEPCENAEGIVGCGTAFELALPATPGGIWTESVLYNFCSNESGGECLDGWFPQAPMIFDAAGNLYGTADGGGGHESAGIVFELSPRSRGWNETVLYNFCSLGDGQACPDGDFPIAGVTFDKFQNLYGTTFDGGTTNTVGEGVVYRLSPSSGTWKESVLTVFPFPGQKYGYPSGGVALDTADNLYGSFQGPDGGVFRLDRASSKRSFFAFNGSDGEQPIGGVTLDLKRGVVYGTNSGNSGGTGNIYQIDAQGKETVLYKFCSQPNCTDGYLPAATLIMDKAGNLYGTTEFGGEYGMGVVFEVTP